MSTEPNILNKPYLQKRGPQHLEKKLENKNTNVPSAAKHTAPQAILPDTNKHIGKSAITQSFLILIDSSSDTPENFLL